MPSERRQRLPLPTYPFERQRYWVEPQKQDYEVNTHQGSLRKEPDIARLVLHSFLETIRHA